MCFFFHPGLEYLQYIKVTLELCEINARFDFHSVLNHYMNRYLQMSQSFKPFSCTYKTIRIQSMNGWTPVSRLLISTVTVPTAKSNMLTHSNLERCGWPAGNMLVRLLLFCKAVVPSLLYRVATLYHLDVAWLRQRLPATELLYRCPAPHRHRH